MTPIDILNLMLVSLKRFHYYQKAVCFLSHLPLLYQFTALSCFYLTFAKWHFGVPGCFFNLCWPGIFSWLGRSKEDRSRVSTWRSKFDSITIWLLIPLSLLPPQVIRSAVHIVMRVKIALWAECCKLYEIRLRLFLRLFL